jgi:tripartite ATP-independent transporter DctM subunit
MMGSPVMSAIGFTAVVSMYIFMGTSFFTQFATVAFGQGTSINQLVAPLFILMAEFLARGGIAEDIYSVLNRLTRKIKGGLAISTTLSCTVFAALCGSSPATAAAIGRISVDQMVSRGYRKDFAIGTVAGGGTLGIMIPPSITLVTFGILTETSIAKLLMAGLIPGLMLSLLMCLSIVLRVRMNPELVGEFRPGKLEAGNYNRNAYAADFRGAVVEDGGMSGRRSRVKDLLRIMPALLLIVVVLGSLYSGLATPTESAGYGALGAFLIVLLQRRMNGRLYLESLKATAKTGTMIIFLVIAGFCLSFVLSYMGVATKLAETIVGLGANRWIIMILLYILWFILGCLMDPASMVILTIPFIYPTLTALNFDPIWIGVVSTFCVEIGMITPPVGLNLFILRSTTSIEMRHILKGSLPYVLVLIIGLVILNLFPDLALWLPSNM